MLHKLADVTHHLQIAGFSRMPGVGLGYPPSTLPTLEVRCAVTVCASRCRSSSRAWEQLSRGRGRPPCSSSDPSSQARPRSACPATLRINSTLFRTTQSCRCKKRHG